MDSLQIRELEKKDLTEIAKIEREAFPTPWSRKTFLKEINNEFAYYLGGLVEGKIVSYIGAWLLDERIHITTLATKMEYRKQGLATLMLHHLLEMAKEIGKEKASLEVRVSNQAAQQLYLKEGFFKISRKQSYYKDNGEDAILMWKVL